MLARIQGGGYACFSGAAEGLKQLWASLESTTAKRSNLL